MTRTAARYDKVARRLHWVTAALFLWQVLSRSWWKTLPEGTDLAFHLAGLHTVGGLAVFGLAVARLVWRRRHPPPAAPADVSRPLRFASAGLHKTLYVLMLGLPVLGFLAVRQPAIAVWHGTLAWFACGLIALHAGAAAWHRWILRDDVLRRML